jgi:hypothetical protein
MELELDSGEYLSKGNDGELSGEQLLNAEYSLQNPANDFKLKYATTAQSEFINENVINSRPVTPHHLRQSQVIQNQFQKHENFASSRTVDRPPTKQTPGPGAGSSNSAYSRQKSSTGMSSKDTNISKQSFSLKNRSNSQNSLIHQQQQQKNSVTFVSKMLDDSRNYDDAADYNRPPSSRYSQNSKGADILVLDPHDTVPERFLQVNESATGFVSKPKVQRSTAADQSMMMARQTHTISNGNGNGYKASLTSMNNSASSFAPKYSQAEPRPSSSNSLKNSSN